jgi:hypothetical protein
MTDPNTDPKGMVLRILRVAELLAGSLDMPTTDVSKKEGQKTQDQQSDVSCTRIEKKQV